MRILLLPFDKYWWQLIFLRKSFFYIRLRWKLQTNFSFKHDDVFLCSFIKLNLYMDLYYGSLQSYAHLE